MGGRGVELKQAGDISGSRLVQPWTKVATSQVPSEAGRGSAKPGLRQKNWETHMAREGPACPRLKQAIYVSWGWGGRLRDPGLRQDGPSIFARNT